MKPDLVLIYQKPGAGTLRLVRLGSHSALGLWLVPREKIGSTAACRARRSARA